MCLFSSFALFFCHHSVYVLCVALDSQQSLLSSILNIATGFPEKNFFILLFAFLLPLFTFTALVINCVAPLGMWQKQW